MFPLSYFATETNMSYKEIQITDVSVSSLITAAGDFKSKRKVSIHDWIRAVGKFKDVNVPGFLFTKTWILLPTSSPVV